VVRPDDTGMLEVELPAISWAAIAVSP